jgi:hypothetical protein
MTYITERDGILPKEKAVLTKDKGSNALRSQNGQIDRLTDG